MCVCRSWACCANKTAPKSKIETCMKIKNTSLFLVSLLNLPASAPPGVQGSIVIALSHKQKCKPRKYAKAIVATSYKITS